VGETQTGAAQGIVFFANGISMAAFTLASGPLFAWGGAIGFYGMAVVAAVGLGFVLLARASSPERGSRR
jgi:PPP family 3-phenylpropionic acid transporter